MNDIKLRVFQILTADVTLTNMLAPNHPAYNQTAAKTREASVVEFTQAGSKIAPFITLRLNATTLVGKTHLTNAFLLIRCYNERDKSFYTINEALSRVQRLLDGKRFDINGYNVVETVWETTGAELPDEGLDMNFRESQFRIQLT